MLALFFVAFRKPKVVPGKFQLLMELGVAVRPGEHRRCRCSGREATAFMPLLASFFFFILIGNLFEVVPGVSFSANSRVAIPLVLALVSWVTYNAVGIRQARVLRLPPAHVHHPGGAGDPALRAVDADRVHLEHRRAADHPHRPSRGQLRRRALPAGDLLPGDARSSSRTDPKTWVLAGVLVPARVVLVGFEIFVAALQAFIFAILSASYIGQAMAEEH